jgi:hypothetical protein
MNALPYTIFFIEATVLDDHYDEPRTKEQLEASFREWAKEKKLKLKAIRVGELFKGMK